MFTEGYGLVVDYLAEALHVLRGKDYSLLARDHFELDASLTKRDRDGTMKTLSGLLKLLYPGKNCSKEELKELLEFAMEGRRRVKDQLLRIDETFEPVAFQFAEKRDGAVTEVDTLEFIQHPRLVQAYENDQAGSASSGSSSSGSVSSGSASSGSASSGSIKPPQDPIKASGPDPQSKSEELEDGKHLVVKENQKGVSYEKLFADYLKDAQRIEVVDPYIRFYHQVRNMMEFCDMILQTLPEGEEVEVSLLTGVETESEQEQEELLDELEEGLSGTGIRFEYKREWSGIHARSIKTDTGWKISLDRGLDIFQRPSSRFDLGRVNQEERRCKPFEVTYLREENITFEVDA